MSRSRAIEIGKLEEEILMTLNGRFVIPLLSSLHWNSVLLQRS